MKANFEDLEYWKNYYEDKIKDLKNFPPSPFAKFLLKNSYIKKFDKIIELGCGNGRDSIYFSKNHVEVTAIDQCSNTTRELNRLEGIISFPADFTRLDQYIYNEKFDVVYSRFTIHSIDENGENRTLKWAYDNLVEGGLFCLETRTTKDPLCGKGIYKGNNIWYYNDHHRRFIDAEKIKKKIENIGFSVEFYKESKGLAKYKSEDPVILRLIASKQ